MSIAVLLCLAAATPATHGVMFNDPYPVYIDTDRTVGGPSLSADELTVHFFFYDELPGTYDLYYATREDTSSSFGAPTPVAELNTEDFERAPHISADGLRLYFMYGTVLSTDEQIYVASRSTVNDPFSNPVHLSELSLSSSFDANPYLTPDELTIVFASAREGIEGEEDLYIATRSSIDDPFNSPVNISELNTPMVEYCPSLSADGLTIFYVQRPDWQNPGSELWMATRPDVYSPFGDAHPITELNMEGVNVHNPRLNYAETKIYFGSPNRPGAEQGVFWMANVIPEPTITITGIAVFLLGIARKNKAIDGLR
jgi:hypothetical protein